MQFGSADLHGMSPEPPNEAEKPWGKLISLNPKTSPNHDLISDRYEIGRGATCDIMISNPGISGAHCKIWREKSDSGRQVVWVEDSRFVDQPL